MKAKIKFEYDGFEYTLEYTAASVKELEKSGFDFSTIEQNMLTAPEELFCGAFIVNHSNVPLAKRKEIYNALKNVSDEGNITIDQAIAAMLNEAIDEITNRKGNVAWRMTK